MAFWSWSRSAGSNTTADSTINWAEGQAPSTVNDSARAMMARTAEWRDDIFGAIATAGTSTAYTLTSYQVFDTLAHMANQMVAFTPHTSNTSTACTLNVDGLGAKPLRLAPNADLPAGTLVQGTPYIATYNNSDAVWYLRNFFNVPWFIPIGASIDYWGATSPSSSFVFPYGQAISRTTYSTLFSLFSTTFGVGDGSTTFNIPDLRGRVVASPDNMGGSDIARLAGSSFFASNRNTVGGSGGEAAHTLTVAELPTGITSSGSASVNTTISNVAFGSLTGTLISGGSGAQFQGFTNGAGSTATISSTGTASVTSTNTSGSTHNVMQPTILGNRLMRIV